MWVEHRNGTADVGAEPGWIASVLLFADDHKLMDAFTYPPAPAYVEPPWSEILHRALSRRSACLLFDHYAAVANPRPDATRIARTRRLCRVLRLLDIRLCDHVIRSDDATFSFRAQGLL